MRHARPMTFAEMQQWDWREPDEDELQCDRCGGEGYLDITDGDGSDWQEDTCADAPGTLIKCRICKGTGRKQ